MYPVNAQVCAIAFGYTFTFVGCVRDILIIFECRQAGHAFKVGPVVNKSSF